VDEGSVINIMYKSMMNDLGILIEELSKSRTTVQGFNLNSQCAIGMIRVGLTMGDLLTPFIFHIIDAKTSYRVLLDDHHEHGIVASLCTNALNTTEAVKGR